MRPQFFLLSCCFPVFIFAQNLNPRNENRILDENIASVQLYLHGSPLSQPYLQVKAPSGALVLEFDHLGEDVQAYQYTIVHCNSDWQVSDLQDNEYISGYTDDRILDVSSSFNTRTSYTHYAIQLPNANMRWTKSGNYLLRVFLEADKTPVLERRFCVMEPQWRVDLQFVLPSTVAKQETHHEMDFSVIFSDTRVKNPMNEVTAVVTQNSRWDNAIGPLAPMATRNDELLFDYQDKVIFPAGREFRYFDISSFNNLTERTRSILVNKNDQFEVTLLPDRSRATAASGFSRDLNGRFSIENTNLNQSLVEADYGWVLFSVAQNAPFEGQDVYIFGEFTDWQLKPQFKMTYHEEAKAYWGEAFLKQGYYNYMYQVVDAATGIPDEEGLEGNDYRTTNRYTVF
ncbi:MAG: DUF5103 domain-containing protein, partial [Saprospiraceae bacterium]